MKTIMDENYYDVAELSQMFGLSGATIRSYFKDGKISAKKIGRSWYAKESDIKNYLDKGKTEVKGTGFKEADKFNKNFNTNY